MTDIWDVVTGLRALAANNLKNKEWGGTELSASLYEMAKVLQEFLEERDTSD